MVIGFRYSDPYIPSHENVHQPWVYLSYIMQDRDDITGFDWGNGEIVWINEKLLQEESLSLL